MQYFPENCPEKLFCFLTNMRYNDNVQISLATLLTLSQKSSGTFITEDTL